MLSFRCSFLDLKLTHWYLDLSIIIFLARTVTLGIASYELLADMWSVGVMTMNSTIAAERSAPRNLVLKSIANAAILWREKGTFEQVLNLPGSNEEANVMNKWLKTALMDRNSEILTLFGTNRRSNFQLNTRYETQRLLSIRSIKKSLDRLFGATRSRWPVQTVQHYYWPGAGRAKKAVQRLFDTPNKWFEQWLWFEQKKL